LAERDDRAMSELLRTIQKEDETLIGTGFDEMQLANLVFVTRDANEIASFDEAAEWAGAGMPDFVPEEESFKLTMHFEDEGKRQEFYKTIKSPHLQNKTGRVWSAWWPSRENRDITKIRYQEDE
jgi:hypothetical protein